MRRAPLLVAALVALAFSGCAIRDAVANGDPSSDAQAGAAIGVAIGGPQGGAIGAAIAVAAGLIVRSIEKRRDRKAFDALVKKESTDADR